MKVYTLKRSQVVHATIGECWAFFSNPANLSKITPASLYFRVLSDTPDKIYAGLMIQYQVKPLMGVPVTWVTEITHVREPEYFSDEQRVGPYAMWHHEHFFKQLDGGRVEIRDMVHYALPFSFLGSIAHELLVKGQLERIFRHREKVVAELFGG
jgi:ligand-binding SRPBCC domain-containing protein